MSLIQRLRDKSGIIIAVLIVLALLAFLLQDAFVGSSSHLFKNDDTGIIAKLKGGNLSYKEFDNLYRVTLENYKRRGVNVDDQMRYELLENIWQQYIYEQLLQREAKANGLEISKVDISQVFWGEHIPLFIREQLTNGHPESYDKDQVKRYFAEMQRVTDKDARKQEFIHELLNPLSKRLLNEKCLVLFQKANYTPNWLNHLDSLDASQRVRADMVFVSFANSKDTLAPTNQDLQDYLQNHRAQYESKEASRTVNLLMFSAAPTPRDTALIFNKLAKLHNSFKQTKDVQGFLVHNSTATPFVNHYFKTKDLLRNPSENIKHLLALSTNEVFGPYKEGDFYQLARLVDKRTLPDSIVCRHILISTRDESGTEIRSDSIAKQLCDSLKRVIAKGGNFAKLAKEWSADGGSKDNGGRYSFSYTQYGQLAPEFAYAIFLGKVGDKKIIKTAFGYHYVEVLAQYNPEIAYQFAFLSKKIVASKHTTDSVFALANQEQASVSSAEKMYANKNSKGVPIPAHTISADDYSLPLAGFARPIIKWAFQAKNGAVSEVYPVGKYYVFMGITASSEAHSLPQQIPPIIVQKVRAEQSGKWLREHTKSQDLASIAKQYSSEVQHLDSIKWDMPVVPTVGLDDALLGAFFRKNKDEMISIPGNIGMAFIKIRERKSTPSRPLSYNIDPNLSVRSLVEGLKKSAKFKSLRDKFY